jgi:putative membrane protein
MMGWYHDGSWGWGGWLLMTLSMALVWGLAIGAIVMLFRSDKSSRPGETAGRQHPEQILAERFARGEIDEDEYRARADVLHHTPAADLAPRTHGAG